MYSKYERDNLIYWVFDCNYNTEERRELYSRFFEAAEGIKRKYPSDMGFVGLASDGRTNTVELVTMPHMIEAFRIELAEMLEILIVDQSN
jgi:hypothetical protein